MNTVNPSQSKLNTAPRRWVRRLGLGCLSLLLGLPLLYYGYCWGLWGRSSLLFQYLFQCNCPPASQEARYPEEVDVVVSACRLVNSRLAPGGNFLYVQETESMPDSTYLLNLRTYQEIPLNLPNSAFYFLTEDLLYVIPNYKGEEYLLNRVTEESYPIQKFTSVYSNAYVNGEINLNLLLKVLRETKDVYLINDDVVVALAPSFPAFPEDSFVTGWFDMPGKNPKLVEKLLIENDIIYKSVPAIFPDEAISPDGKFLARSDGIYLVETEEKIVEGYSSSRSFRPYSRKYFSVRGWTYDGTSVIYSKFLNPCLIEAKFLIFDDYGCYLEVPQAVLLLKVPEKYWKSTATP